MRFISDLNVKWLHINKILKPMDYSLGVMCYGVLLGRGWLNATAVNCSAQLTEITTPGKKHLPHVLSGEGHRLKK